MSNSAAFLVNKIVPESKAAPAFIVAVAFLAQVMLSLDLWIPIHRTFPAIPVWGIAYWPQNDWKLVLSGSLLLGSTAILVGLKIFERSKITLWVLAATLAVLTDLNRLQPWLYFYALVLLAAGFADKNQRMAVTLILSAVYVWGGLNKLNPYFIDDNWLFLTDAFAFTRNLGKIKATGYAAALMETMLGIGLLFLRTRQIAAIFIIFFHGMIILALSPLGLNWNTVVIPWNAAMAVLAAWCVSKPFSITPFKSPITVIAVILAYLMPLANWFGLWLPALSWTMYDNTQDELTLEPEKCQEGSGFSNAVAVYADSAFGGKIFVSDWAMQDFSAPPFSNKGAFLKTALLMCKECNSSKFFMLHTNRWDKSREIFSETQCSKDKK